PCFLVCRQHTESLGSYRGGFVRIRGRGFMPRAALLALAAGLLLAAGTGVALSAGPGPTPPPKAPPPTPQPAPSPPPATQPPPPTSSTPGPSTRKGPDPRNRAGSGPHAAGTLGAIIDDGTVMLGVNSTGDLNFCCGAPSSETVRTIVGL